MTSTLGDDQAGEVRALRALLGELLDRWDNGTTKGRTPRGRKLEAVRLTAVMTLSSHTHRLGRAVAMLVDAGFDLETAPTVRSVLEYGLTAQWLVQYGDEAMYGFATEAQRQRVNTAKLLRKLMSAMQSDTADEVLELLDADIQITIERTAADASARNFSALCGDFAAGTAYYFMYRVLSEFVHPGPTVGEAYVDNHEPPIFRMTPRPVSDPKMWLYQTCCGVIWAARAADILDGDHPNRDFLRRVAKQLGIPVELKLSDGAFVRREQDRHNRRETQAAPGVSSPCRA